MPRFMASVMENQAVNGGGTPVLVPPGPIRSLTVNYKTYSFIEVVWNPPNTGGFWDGTLLFITLDSKVPDPNTAPGGVTVNQPTTTTTFISLTASTPYWIWAFAYNISGYSSVSSVSTTTNDPPRPDPVTGLTIFSRTTDALNITWNLPLAGVYDNAMLYIQLDSTAPDPQLNPSLITVASPTASYSFSGLTQDTLYYIFVFSQNSSGFSTPATVSGKTDATPLPPDPPTGLAQDAATSFTVTATWFAPLLGPTPTGYRIYINTTNSLPSSSTDVGNILTYEITGLTSLVTYYVWVSALNAVGESSTDGPVTMNTF